LCPTSGQHRYHQPRTLNPAATQGGGTSYVQRHVRGDWGEIDEATGQANDVALQQDNLMISSYRITSELVLIVKTSEDHQTTVVQLSEERDMI
ncbi:hypothetical protein ACULL0_04375, partial [Xanthomonas arboricola pv. corylina]